MSPQPMLDDETDGVLMNASGHVVIAVGGCHGNVFAIVCAFDLHGVSGRATICSTSVVGGPDCMLQSGFCTEISVVELLG